MGEVERPPPPPQEPKNSPQYAAQQLRKEFPKLHYDGSNKPVTKLSTKAIALVNMAIAGNKEIGLSVWTPLAITNALTRRGEYLAESTISLVESSIGDHRMQAFRDKLRELTAGQRRAYAGVPASAYPAVAKQLDEQRRQFERTYLEIQAASEDWQVDVRHIVEALLATPPSGLTECLSAAGMTGGEFLAGVGKAPDGMWMASRLGGEYGHGGWLKRLGRDLTKTAERGLPPHFGRHTQLMSMVGYLNQESVNSVMVLGEPGVGKSKLLEELAVLVAEGKVSPAICSRLIQIDPNTVIAGGGYRGEIEARWKGIIDDCLALRRKGQEVVVFFDEAHSIFMSSTGHTTSQALKGAIGAGEIKVIFATTNAECSQYIATDTAVMRRFNRLTLEPPDVAECATMLKPIMDTWRAKYDMRIKEEALRLATELCQKYVKFKMPASAIKLLDMARSDALESSVTSDSKLRSLKVQREGLQIDIRFAEHDENLLVESTQRRLREWKRALQRLDAEITDEQARLDQLLESRNLEKKIKQLEVEKKRAGRRVDMVRGPQLRDEINALKLRLADIPVSPVPVLDEDCVMRALYKYVGVRLFDLSDDMQSRLANLENALGQRVFGQTHAVEKISKSIRLAIEHTGRVTPISKCMLVGPPATGKTRMASALAECVFGNSNAFLFLNGADYKHSAADLLGHQGGKPGRLTEFVRANPDSVIIVDEMEKGRKPLREAFLSVCAHGTAFDQATGEDVSFARAIILFTTNIGQRLFVSGVKALDPATLKALTDEIVAETSPEFMTRMDVIPFLPLDQRGFSFIILAKLQALGADLALGRRITFSFQAASVKWLASRTYGRMDARHAEEEVAQQVMMLLGKADRTEKIRGKTVELVWEPDNDTDASYRGEGHLGVRVEGA